MSGNTNNKSIFHFFPKSAKPEVVSCSDFYKDNLPNSVKEKPTAEKQAKAKTSEVLSLENEKLKSDLKDAHSKIEQLTKENTKIRNDLISLKKLYNATCRSNVQKDFKIKLLEKKFVKENGTNSANSENKIMFEQHESIFDEQALVKLRSMNETKRNDSTFVLICMQTLYANSLSTLHLKSASGNYKEKTQISPEKREIISSLMLERLSTAAMDEEDANTRYLRLNDLINNAINNISRKVMTKYFTAFHFISSHLLYCSVVFFSLKLTTKPKQAISTATAAMNTATIATAKENALPLAMDEENTSRLEPAVSTFVDCTRLASAELSPLNAIKPRRLPFNEF